MDPMPLDPAGEAEVPGREGDHKLMRMSAQGQTAGGPSRRLEGLT